MFQGYPRQLSIRKHYGFASRSLAIIGSLILLLHSSLSFSQQTKGEEVVTPSAVIDVVHVQPFSLKNGYTHFWRAEKPFVKSGTLAVFKVNPAFVYPRNALEPVLYVGNQTAERLNFGNESGFVVAIIPGDIDLSKSRAWFGKPELPERVNEKTIMMEMELADREKIQPLNPDAVLKATHQKVDSPDLATLLRDHAAELVLKFSPQEKALVEAWRLPVAKR